MKLAVLSESSADDAAIRVLVEALLDVSTESVPLKSIRRRSGVSTIPVILPEVLRELYFDPTADAIVIVVDSNGTPVHAAAHDGQPDARCRLCELRRIVQLNLSALPARPGAPNLHAAVGLACPSIEAWYLCGKDPTSTEAAWGRVQDKKAAARQRIRELKKRIYGTDRPSLALETQRAVTAARRLAADLSTLEQHFPMGFGALARDVRSWCETT